jgi:hypothetical protein
LRIKSRNYLNNQGYLWLAPQKEAADIGRVNIATNGGFLVRLPVLALGADWPKHGYESIVWRYVKRWGG